ncbi:multiple epidermal growth factor-like domains protein 8 [Vombatus ursinus]|uniref:multiple epidermal growth factor-like domains protein 8 n=1 Tax=Vombatus ursinus TaxID=29139 RepID=UPI000FFD27A9|nr:multiple epidermal growth factor-like domains protein 8 [Vombatus ursinus]
MCKGRGGAATPRRRGRRGPPRPLCPPHSRCFSGSGAALSRSSGVSLVPVWSVWLREEAVSARAGYVGPRGTCRAARSALSPPGPARPGPARPSRPAASLRRRQGLRGLRPPPPLQGPSPLSRGPSPFVGDPPPGNFPYLSGSSRPWQMLLHLFSDANYNLLGFNASFSFSLCPGGCSGRGLCEPSGLCTCEPGWGGPACALQDCSTYCHEHGTCASEAGPCRCEPGFLGRACDLRLWENQGAGWWHNVSAKDAAFPARIGAAGAFLSPPGLLAVFGGQDLNSALGDLVLYNFSANAWERWDLSPGPAARHSHVAVAWAGSLVLMGGELADGSLTSDVWAFSPQAGGHWELLAPPSSGPPGLAGHAAALVDDSWLYIFGGRTQHDLFSSGLFRFRLEGPGWGRGHWEEVQPAGGRPPAATGHSMIFHPPSRALLVYGGHRPSTARFSVRVNSTELFHVDLRMWTSLRGRDGQRGPRERAFHTASVLGNYMVVYGGNVHTHYQEEKCYEDGIFFYHLGCHQWVSGAELAPPGTPEGRAAPPGGRYSHVAAVLGGSVLLVAGGYSGRPRGDLMAYKVPPFVFQAPAPDVSSCGGWRRGTAVAGEWWL